MVKYKWLGKTRSNFRVKIKQRQMTVGYEFAGHSKTLKKFDYNFEHRRLFYQIYISIIIPFLQRT